MREYFTSSMSPPIYIMPLFGDDTSIMNFAINETREYGPLYTKSVIIIAFLQA